MQQAECFPKPTHPISKEMDCSATDHPVDGSKQQKPVENRTLRQFKPVNQLSKRELEILKLLIEGRSNTEIATVLYLSPNTIKTHIRGILNKLSVENRIQAAVAAVRMGLL
ncbi:MAG: response regulator transcription factor [Leptolyngbyaceae cyanobacterium RM2_2_4]|nr:response regulator transcription factor [Leptolyngbyaceae cyanobacterium SM1_4_3]NJO51934.1 response regulator transcription factor [Leptolyngbyaceae cyanobacterium RM2_2_4]